MNTEKAATADTRIELRAPRSAKDLLQKAARLSNKSISAYVLETILSRAQEDVLRQETIALKEKDSVAFLAAITSPAEPNRALRRFFDKTNS